jgi:hypothetical protein
MDKTLVLTLALVLTLTFVLTLLEYVITVPLIYGEKPNKFKNGHLLPLLLQQFSGTLIPNPFPARLHNPTRRAQNIAGRIRLRSLCLSYFALAPGHEAIARGGWC